MPWRVSQKRPDRLRPTGKRTRAANRPERTVSESGLLVACVGALLRNHGRQKAGHQEVTVMNRFRFQAFAIVRGHSADDGPDPSTAPRGL